MTKQPIFRGAATAIVTPFKNHEIDYDAFARMIEFQIAEGINALVVAGTSGEGATLSDAEHRKLLAFAKKQIAGRVPMIAGSGSNDTAYAIELSQYACSIGVDGLLAVTPYYNKTTQAGLVEMYTQLADHVTKPIILYNVPSRTGVNIEPETFAALADHPMIAGIKESSGNIAKIVKTASLIGDRLTLYSGDDDQVIPILALGGQGVISVASNLVPKRTVEMCSRFFSGDLDGARALQFQTLPLIASLFSEVNPIPVKAAMAALGKCEYELRLPLVKMGSENYERLMQVMREQGLL